jgi:hypothetical protein
MFMGANSYFSCVADVSVSATKYIQDDSISKSCFEIESCLLFTKDDAWSDLHFHTSTNLCTHKYERCHILSWSGGKVDITHLSLLCVVVYRLEIPGTHSLHGESRTWVRFQPCYGVVCEISAVVEYWWFSFQNVTIIVSGEVKLHSSPLMIWCAFRCRKLYQLPHVFDFVFLCRFLDINKFWIYNIHIFFF